MCDLAEWGVVIDNEEEVQKILSDYFAPMWENSFTGEDVDVDMVMDGLEVNRDGEQGTFYNDLESGGAGQHLMPHGSGSEYYLQEQDVNGEVVDMNERGEFQVADNEKKDDVKE